jgi:signal transduction histidine kinase
MSVQSSHQLSALRDAVLAISASLSVPETLEHIVAAAARLAGARYAALGVPDEAGERLIEFVTHGLSSEAEGHIHHRPEGRGLLGLLLRETQSLRLRDLRQHPAAAGFPPNHPPMTSFLGVPIRHGTRIVGNFYLTDKLGADEFSEADQALIELLAAHAAHALANARLHAAALDHQRELQRRNAELRAFNAVITATSASLSLDRVLEEALREVMAVYQAEAADIYLADPDGGDLHLAVHHGPLPEPFLTHRRVGRGEGLVGTVAVTGQPIVREDVAADPGFLRQDVVAAGFRALVCQPLIGRGGCVGTLNLFYREPERCRRLSAAQLAAIAGQIAIAVENARLHEQVRMLAVKEERQRIGMGLHDGVIQAIYAAGLTLELALAQLADGDPALAAEGVRGTIGQLNTTIHDIRSYLLALRPRRLDGPELGASLERLLGEFRANTQIAVELNLDPAAEHALTPDDRSTLFHIAQEALSNAARHSRATRVRVSLDGDAEWVVLAVCDNGRGLPADLAQHDGGHGLRNMRDRARALGGQVSVTGTHNAGTEVRVSLPRRGA